MVKGELIDQELRSDHLDVAVATQTIAALHRRRPDGGDESEHRQTQAEKENF
jgi:hypothetical protein